MAASGACYPVCVLQSSVFTFFRKYGFPTVQTRPPCLYITTFFAWPPPEMIPVFSLSSSLFSLFFSWGGVCFFFFFFVCLRRCGSLGRFFKPPAIHRFPLGRLAHPCRYHLLLVLLSPFFFVTRLIYAVFVLVSCFFWFYPAIDFLTATISPPL